MIKARKNLLDVTMKSKPTIKMRSNLFFIRPIYLLLCTLFLLFCFLTVSCNNNSEINDPDIEIENPDINDDDGGSSTDSDDDNEGDSDDDNEGDGEDDNEGDGEDDNSNEDFDSTFQKILSEELKGVYDGAVLETRFPFQPLPKLFIDSLMILSNGRKSVIKIDTISLVKFNNATGSSNSINNDVLIYSQRISTYQGIVYTIVRSKKEIWTESSYSHNVPQGYLKWTGYYRKAE
jgi:hypothetical protein